jgi:hypothetical protein
MSASDAVVKLPRGYGRDLQEFERLMEVFDRQLTIGRTAPRRNHSAFLCRILGEVRTIPLCGRT